MKLPDNIAEIKNKFKSLLIEKNEEEGLEHDAYMLMAGYLSEIEAIQENKNMTRKELASRINISASYLTQVFRGDKPMNFYTLAKIQRVLKIKFKVSTVYTTQSPVYVIDLAPILEDYLPINNTTKYQTNMYIVKGGALSTFPEKTA